MTQRIRIGADDPELGGRMNPDEGLGCIETETEIAGPTLSWRQASRWTLRAFYLAVLLPLFAHLIERVAVAAWGLGG